ncbi:MAG: Do family serine endopeptidase [Hellea sp.]|nr:Do family serine endopeptidase [Hellea sp.]
MRKFLFGTALGVLLISSPAAISQNNDFFGLPFGQNAAMTVDQERGVLTMAPLLDRVTPAVVSIRTEGKSQPANSNRNELLERFFGDSLPESRRGGSIGSGVIVDAGNGYILTNNHVVENADEVIVTLQDKRELVASLVGGDPRTDLAVLKIEASNLTDIAFAPTDSTRVGDYVIAIGNAFGLQHTVTSGIVSATGRAVQGGDRLQDMIQTDASINPGNSGGALINSKGELIGINTMIISRSGGNNGIGFAVPVRLAENVMNQLIDYGEVRRGRIGVSIRDIDPTLQQAMNLATMNGALVNDVVEESPADKAGLKSGDIIVGFNGEDILDSNDIRNAVSLVEPGNRADLTYLRDGRRRTTRIGVEAVESDLETASQSTKSANKSSGSETFSGARLTDIPEEMELREGQSGVYVASVTPNSDAAKAGLRRGDIIRKIGSKQVTDLKDFREINDNREGPVALSVEREGTNLFIAVK